MEGIDKRKEIDMANLEAAYKKFLGPPRDTTRHLWERVWVEVHNSEMRLYEDGDNW
jgi:hypothetical protein